MASRSSFTPALLDSLKIQSGTATIFVEDPVTPCLRLVVRSSGLKSWTYRRRIRGRDAGVKMTLGPFPVYSIADARKWANGISDQITPGIDPREKARKEEAYRAMTVDKAHGLYKETVREGRSSNARKPNRPRSIADKLKVYNRDVRTGIGQKIIYEVTKADLIALVEQKGKLSKILANRLGSELHVFFGWASSLRGLAVGLAENPARRLADLRFPEPRRSRLGPQELMWFLQGLVDEPAHFRRGMLLWALTATRFSELIFARPGDIADGVWTVSDDLAKNGFAHRIPLALT